MHVSVKARKEAISGNFTTIGNMHTTLVFIGEATLEETKEVKALVDRICYPKFVIETGNLGFFNNRGSKSILVWHIRKSPELESLVRDLSAKLEKAGFTLDKREYRPHFTIARQVAFPPGEKEQIVRISENPFFIRCDRISLMESIRIGGKLVYREISGKDFSDSKE